MSVKNPQNNNVLSFQRASQHTAAAEVDALLAIYDQLIALLRETDDDGLDALTDSLVVSVVRCREALAKGIDEKTGREMVKEMREGLRQIPQTLRSLLPGLGPRLGESMEQKLGIRFSGY
jgi:hypothetical protein